MKISSKQHELDKFKTENSKLDEEIKRLKNKHSNEIEELRKENKDVKAQLSETFSLYHEVNKNELEEELQKEFFKELQHKIGEYFQHANNKADNEEIVEQLNKNELEEELQKEFFKELQHKIGEYFQHANNKADNEEIDSSGFIGLRIGTLEVVDFYRSKYLDDTCGLNGKRAVNQRKIQYEVW
ncbi:hypothetical protein Glove_21g147 [Diversispora epigaea]|uniref:Uncharacterized protein n=1 Tax=Diversispora epigaea TaxID=1348612 RepID=A0A397JVH9_9GLOM|nr:hypothetical protein Glove_21g147 [Diversispora epigaea]